MSLRKKLEALEASLGSPSDTAAGFARRLIKESPAPSVLCRTPKLSTPTGQTQEIDLDTSADLFATPKPLSSSSSPGPSKKRPRHTEQQNTARNGFRVPSAVGKPTGLSAVSKESLAKHAASATSRNVSRTFGHSSSMLNISNKPSAAMRKLLFRQQRSSHPVIRSCSWVVL